MGHKEKAKEAVQTLERIVKARGRGGGGGNTVNAKKTAEPRVTNMTNINHWWPLSSLHTKAW